MSFVQRCMRRFTRRMVLAALTTAVAAGCAAAVKTHEAASLNLALDYPEAWVVAQPQSQTLLVTDENTCALTIFPADHPSASTMGVLYRPGLSADDLLEQFGPVVSSLDRDDPVETGFGEALTAYREETTRTGRYVAVLAISDEEMLIFLSSIGQEYELKDDCVPTYREIIASVRPLE